MRKVLGCLIFFYLSSTLFAGGGELRFREELLRNFSLIDTGVKFWTPRRITALKYSLFIPGSGQIYLGHKLKGAIFVLSAFGSVVTAVVSQNNLVGGNERLENLEIAYYSTLNWEKADKIWREMLSVKADVDRYYKNRNLFTAISIGIWIANIIDVIFFTPDRGGEEIFGEIGVEKRGGLLMLTAKLRF